MSKYLGRILERSNNYWPEVLRNIRKVWQVWERLGQMLWRGGVELAVSEKFYRKVIHAVMLFGEERWVLSVPMAQMLEGVRLGFLRQVVKFKAKRLRDGLWRKLAADKVLQGAGI